MTRRLWIAVFGSIGAWAAHLVFEASFVQYACNTGRDWAMHAATAVTAAAALAAMGISWQAIRMNVGDESDAAPAGQLRFLGQLALIVSAVNLVLIVLEGAYVFALKPCA